MSDGEGRFESMMRKLEVERDELRVKLNLAKLEARDEWEDLEKKMASLKGRMKVVKEEAKEASGDIGDAFDALATEIKEGLSRIRRML